MAALQDPDKGLPVAEKPEAQTGKTKPAFHYSKFAHSWWQRLFFINTDPLIYHAYRWRRLEQEDLFTEDAVKTEGLISTFESGYKEAKSRLTSEEEQVALWRIIFHGNYLRLFYTAILYVIAQACTLAGPLLLQRIVSGLNCRALIGVVPGIECEAQSALYYYCIGLFLAPAIQSLCENTYTYHLFLIGTRMRNSLMAAIYRKCLRLSNSSMQQESTGKVVTYMSNDAQKVQDAMSAIHTIWGSPIYIIAILVLLYQQVKWATFVGLGIMLLLGPLSGMLAAKLAKLRREILQWTERRVGYMSEIIQGIQMIKFYAWEAPFAEKVQGARAQEKRILKITAFWQGIFAFILFTGPVMVAIFCFGSYTLAGNTLSNAQAYTALALFALLRFPMSFLPMYIQFVINAVVALKRIGAFLSRTENTLAQEALSPDHPAGVVEVRDGEFAWDETQTKSTLRGVNFRAASGSLTMVVGAVGSGKSSVLGALTGHISKRSGSVAVGGRVAYVAQTAWIMNDTVQENILLGSEVEPDRYRMAVKVSQLEPDLKILPNGDLTEIGDRGITLSGGQKQRVSIARAVYSDADVYLLDDPLSAVDSHVGRALFEECIQGPLRSKTVVLVTNALQYLPYADNILWMDNGEVRAQGTYTQLVEMGLDIEELAHMHEEEEAAAEQEEADTKEAQAQAKEVAASKGDAAKGELANGAAGGKPGAPDKTMTMKRAQADANRNLTGIEERETGTISLEVLRTYWGSAGGLFLVITLLFLFGVEQAARVYTDRWVGIWFSDEYGKGLGFYLGIYFGLGVFFGLMTFARSLRFLFACVHASVNVHNKLLHHILRLPKTFFDTNPAGRVLNRFSRDTDIMDSTLATSLIQFTNCMATLVASLVVIAVATKWFGVAIPFLLIIYVFMQRFYIPAARELQRIESVSRSPIYARFAEAMLGVPTIRAYRKESHFTKVSDELMERNANAFMTQKLAAGWLAMRLDVMGICILVGCGALLIAGSISPALAGLALSYALDLTRFLKFGTQVASQAEANFNSVERIVQYLRPEPEARPDTPDEVKAIMPKEWPSAGAISVQKLTMRYRRDTPLVLKGISFEVEGGQKVGLVGRTGSGKSSILMALFRMVEPESGRIVIDGVDISTLGVRDLRSKLSIIPQDPFMFSGTVRSNLDPLGQYTDERLWEVVEQVGLKDAILQLEERLTAKVADNGANFSLGQRQLFCMARAMLRNSRILMLDEATASVDLDTDNMIQVAIREAFSDCTTITIAHRLVTIMDADKVVVLDHGLVVEEGHPHDMLVDENGKFTSMVNQTGKSSARYLKEMAASSKRGESVRNFSRRTGLSMGSSRPATASEITWGQLPDHELGSAGNSTNRSFTTGQHFVKPSGRSLTSRLRPGAASFGGGASAPASPAQGNTPRAAHSTAPASPMTVADASADLVVDLSGQGKNEPLGHTFAAQSVISQMNIPSQSGAASIAAEVIEEGNEAQEEGAGNVEQQSQPQQVHVAQQEGGQVASAPSDHVVLKRMDV